MTWTFCTSGSAVRKAGANANATIIASGSALAAWCDEAENMACMISRIDLIGNYASLTTNGKQILQQYTTACIAQNIINYDPDEIGSGTATLMLNILENQKNEAEKKLRDKTFTQYLGVSTA